MPAPLAKLTDKQPSSSTYFFPSNLGSVGHYVMFTTYPTVAQDVQQINLTFGPGGYAESGLAIKRTIPAAGDMVALYLPAVITNNQSAKYGDVEMGTLLSVLGKDGGAIDESVKKLALEKVKQVGGAEGRSLAAAE